MVVSFAGKFTAATPPQETKDLNSFGFVASHVDSGFKLRDHSKGMLRVMIRADDE